MRVVVVEAARPQRPAPRGFRWSPARLALIVCAYTLPLALLCLRLHGEMQDGTLPLDGSAVLMRFIVVGLFTLLLGHWCMRWIKGGH